MVGASTMVLAPPASKRTRILLIDDEQRILDFVSRGLEAEGYSVEVAADGDAGVRAALDQAHDLVILDLLLPDRGGHDVLRGLVRQRRGGPLLVLPATSATSSHAYSMTLA